MDVEGLIVSRLLEGYFGSGGTATLEDDYYGDGGVTTIKAMVG